MNDYLMIGEVLKPQGVRGECKIRSYAADVDMFHEWKTLYRKTKEGYAPVTVRTARIRDGFVYAFLDGSGSAVDFTYQHFPVNPKMAPTNVVVGTMEGKCEISLQGTIDFYTHVSAGDTALDRGRGFEPDTGYTNRVQLSQTFIFIRNNFQQGCREHIARSSHAAFKI